MKTRNKVKKVLASKIYIKKSIFHPDRKLVSFTFDDVDKSAFQFAGPLLHENGVQGTFYVAFSLMEGQIGEESIFDVTDINNCVSQGHELGCHTYSHLHAFDSTVKQFENDLHRNQQILQSLKPDLVFKSFSYPYGEQTPRVKSLTNRKFESARGITSGINLGTCDLNDLKGISLNERSNPLEKLKSILQDLEQGGGWLIFFGHDVKKDFSKYGCSPNYLERVIGMVQEMNLEVKTVRDVVSGNQ